MTIEARPRRRRHGRAPVGALIAVLVVLATVPKVGPAAAATGELWTLRGTDPVSAAIALSRQAFPSGVSHAVLARADAFPDAVASGLLQGDGPLLLTGGDALDDATAAELARLDVARVTLLGGEGALSTAVAAELTDAGYAVERLAGATRVETAVTVASSRPAARTAILIRASAAGDDPTRAFADALAAGAWSAASGYPVLLSDTDTLSPATAAYLERAGVRTVMLVGGTAALSTAVERQLLARGLVVRRVSGPDRAATAVAVAGAQGFGSAGDAVRVVLVDGRAAQGWAAGFAAAALAAQEPTVLVLADGATVPEPTRRFLEKGTGELVCTPLLETAACRDAAAVLGLPAPVVHGFPATDLTEAERAAGVARSYAITTAGGGPLTVALVDASAGGTDDGGWVLDDDGDGSADLATETTARIVGVADAAITPAPVVTGLAPHGGRLAFTVGSAEPNAAVRPVVFVDTDGDGALAVDGDGTPTEPAAVGGPTVWVPDTAATGSHADLAVGWASPGRGLFTTATATFRWDGGDTFAYNSGLAQATTITRAQFESMIGPGDVVAANVGARSRYTIVRDVPATVGGVTAAPADLDGDGAADAVRVRWQRPANIDLAATDTYEVQRSSRQDEGWSGWAVAGEGAAPAVVEADVDAEAGIHRFRVVASGGAGDAGPAGRPVLVTMGSGSGTRPPACLEATFTAGSAQPDSNTVLDTGDRMTFTFDGAVSLSAGASIDLRDADGTAVRIVRDRHAAFAVSGENGEVLTVSVTAPVVEHGGSTGDDELDVDELVVVEAATGVGNPAGLWNLPESGRADAEEERSRTVVGDVGDLPEAIASGEVHADAGLGEITIAAEATGIADGDRFAVFDHRGRRIAGGEYDDDGVSLDSDDFAVGERLYVVYASDEREGLPSATTTLLVPSPLPAVSAVHGSGDSLVVVWDEDVELTGDEDDITVYDAADRTLVSTADDVEEAGDDRILVELDEELTVGTRYVVRIRAGLVEDAAEDGNAARSVAFTAAAAAPTLVVTGDPVTAADPDDPGATVVTWRGTASDTIGVVTAVRYRFAGASAWENDAVDADVPDDDVTWTVTLTLQAGTHTVEFQSRDDSGAESATVSRTVTVP